MALWLYGFRIIQFAQEVHQCSTRHLLCHFARPKDESRPLSRYVYNLVA